VRHLAGRRDKRGAAWAPTPDMRTRAQPGRHCYASHAAARPPWANVLPVAPASRGRRRPGSGLALLPFGATSKALRRRRDLKIVNLL